MNTATRMEETSLNLIYIALDLQIEVGDDVTRVEFNFFKYFIIFANSSNDLREREGREI